jgi:hypothetical protein
LVGALLVVLPEPQLQISLEFLEAGIDLLAKGNAVALIEHGFMEPLTNPIGLGTFALGAGVIDILNRQIEFILVAVGTATVLRAPIGQDAAEGDLMAVKERDHPIIE